MPTVLVQRWEESERGWGVRPDGYSIHLSATDRDTYVEKYWARMPKAVPDEYSRPSGVPYWADVAKHLYIELKHSKYYGVRFYGSNYPKEK